MPKRLLSSFQQVLADHGLLAALGAFFTAIIALAFSTVRRALTNEEAVKRIDQSITSRIDSWEEARKRDREEIKQELLETRQEFRKTSERLHQRIDEVYAKGKHDG